MKVKVVIGANYGDEGKGLVSGCLAREANKRKEKVLTVFYNGTQQRAHTFEGEIHRAMAAGTKYGSDTFYHRQFVIDPISIYILQAKPIIDPMCRVILPCDVLKNRELEIGRGKNRHGSCGFGLFEAVKRSRNEEFCVYAHELLNGFQLFEKLKHVELAYPAAEDHVYNLHNFLCAASYITSKCKVEKFENVVKNYDTIIYEGGQGLCLDQRNMGDFPHLTPSSPGSRNIVGDINKLGVVPEIFYVSRSYITRHGAGPMDMECKKEDINNTIVDETNSKNEFQGKLRFGKINLDKQRKLIENDSSLYNDKVVNMVFTQMNYTNGNLVTTKGTTANVDLTFANHVYLSDQKDNMELLA